MQTEIDFTDQTLRRHNNVESEDQVLQAVDHFNGQAGLVYDYLMRGNVIDTDIAREVFMSKLLYGDRATKIEDLRARIHSIGKAGFHVQDEKYKYKRANGKKYWFMTPDDIEFNGVLAVKLAKEKVLAKAMKK